MAERLSEVLVIRDEKLPEDATGLTVRMRRTAEELHALSEDVTKVAGMNEAESSALLAALAESSIVPDLVSACQSVRSLLWAHFLQLMRQRNDSVDVYERGMLSARAKVLLDQIETLSRIAPPKDIPKEAA